MKREQAEKITTAYLKPIYGFALKRCANLQDAEDLTQETVMKVFHALLCRDDIEAPQSFIWTAAHNTLANYYRKKAKTTVGIPIDDVAELLPSDSDTANSVIETETINRLRREIAYLSKLQRRIVIAFYFENKTQQAIADELGIPLGTVKWHLFEAKKELKRGMHTMRETGELRFIPIQFDLCTTNGLPGTKGPNYNFFHSTLSQNIVYAVWKEAKTAGEIADQLGVSPVYVESEADYLAEYGFLREKGGKYLCNILLEEPGGERIALRDEMYCQAAKLFANDLWEELTGSGILRDPRIQCGQSGQAIASSKKARADDSFLLWSLVPFIAAQSGERLMDTSISFEEAATIRPDGGHNICHASVAAPNEKLPVYFESMLRFRGPYWNQNQEYILWQIDSEWSSERVTDGYLEKAARILSVLSRLNHSSKKEISREDIAFLEEEGILNAQPDCGENRERLSFVPRVVWLQNCEIKKELLSIGDRIKERHWAAFEAAKEPFVNAVLKETPKHLRKMQLFELQYVFFSDGWFILHCMKELVNSGRLRLPTEEEKKSLTTMIIPNE